MCIKQENLELIFELELMFNHYRGLMTNPHISEEFKQFSDKSFEEFTPSIQKYVEQMRSFRQPQVEKEPIKEKQIDILWSKIRQIEKQTNEIHTKTPEFQDNFNRLRTCLLQAQYHLTILNQECFIDNPNHEIVITNLKDFEKQD